MWVIYLSSGKTSIRDGARGGGSKKVVSGMLEPKGGVEGLVSDAVEVFPTTSATIHVLCSNCSSPLLLFLVHSVGQFALQEIYDVPFTF